MIDKSKRVATVEQHGTMVIVRMKGGYDCLWLNMYLDSEDWQMTCDSDIGFYAYHWGKPICATESFIEFCCNWLHDDEWLLRKCIGERRCDKEFNCDETKRNLRQLFEDEGEEQKKKLESALQTAENWYSDEESWVTAFLMAADRERLDLPDEWWVNIENDYSAWQKRFAEICAEVIVPRLMPLIN